MQTLSNKHSNLCLSLTLVGEGVRRKCSVQGSKAVPARKQGSSSCLCGCVLSLSQAQLRAIPAHELLCGYSVTWSSTMLVWSASKVSPEAQRSNTELWVLYSGDTRCFCSVFWSQGASWAIVYAVPVWYPLRGLWEPFPYKAAINTDIGKWPEFLENCPL